MASLPFRLHLHSLRTNPGESLQELSWSFRPPDILVTRAKGKKITKDVQNKILVPLLRFQSAIVKPNICLEFC